MPSPENRGVKFTHESAQRIARAVAIVERGNRDQKGQRIRTAFDDSDPVRICKTTEEWLPNTMATLDVWEDGDPEAPEQTADETLDAYNLTHTVDADTFVVVARAVNGEWYLVESGSGSDRVRVRDTTAAWTKGTSATFDADDPENTFEAQNETHDVPADTTVILARADDGDWYLVEQDNGCDSGKTRSSWLDADAEGETTEDWKTDGDGPQALLNVNGCTQWVKLKKQQIVEKVEWDDGIKVTTKYVYVLEYDEAPAAETIIESTDCEPPPPE